MNKTTKGKNQILKKKISINPKKAERGSGNKEQMGKTENT